MQSIAKHIEQKLRLGGGTRVMARTFSSQEVGEGRLATTGQGQRDSS